MSIFTNPNQSQVGTAGNIFNKPVSPSGGGIFSNPNSGNPFASKPTTGQSTSLFSQGGGQGMGQGTMGQGIGQSMGQGMGQGMMGQGMMGQSQGMSQGMGQGMGQPQTGGSLFNNPITQSNPTQSNLFTQSTTQPNTPLFGNQPTSSGQPSSGSLFSNPTSTQPNSTLFTNPSQTTAAKTPLFGGPQTPQKGGSLFSQPTGNAPTSGGLFTNTPAIATPNTGGLFSGLNTQPQFQPQTQFQAQPQLQPQTQGLNLNLGTSKTGLLTQNTPPVGFFDNALRKVDSLATVQQTQKAHAQSIIENYKVGSIKSKLADSLQALILPAANSLRNTKINSIANTTFQNFLISLIEKFLNMEEGVRKIYKGQLELLDLIEGLHTGILMKLKAYKYSFLQSFQLSKHLHGIQQMLTSVESLVNNEFKLFLECIRTGRPLQVVRPSEFELLLSRQMLERARALFEEVKQYSECQNSAQEENSKTHVFEVIKGMVQYFKNVNCLVYEFKDKYNMVKEKTQKSTKTMISSNETATLSSLITNFEETNERFFDKISNAEKDVKLISQKVKDLKLKYKEDMEKICDKV